MVLTQFLELLFYKRVFSVRLVHIDFNHHIHLSKVYGETLAFIWKCNFEMIWNYSEEAYMYIEFWRQLSIMWHIASKYFEASMFIVCFVEYSQVKTFGKNIAAQAGKSSRLQVRHRHRHTSHCVLPSIIVTSILAINVNVYVCGCIRLFFISYLFTGDILKEMLMLSINVDQYQTFSWTF